MRLRLSQFLTLSLLAISARSYAQEADVFAALDADKDGFLTATEVPDNKKPLFERMLRTNDKNGDGKISREEFGAKEAEGPKNALGPGAVGGEKIDPAQVIKMFDKNGDGKISKDEAPDRMKDNFERIDANSDGFVDLTEFQQAVARMAGGDGGGPNAIFDRQDANKDGKLTADEIPEERRERFKEMLNRLGVDSVDREQFVRAIAMMRGDGPPNGGANAGGPPGAPPNGPPSGMMRGPLMRVLDANSDGELSADEIANAPKALAQLDKDGDGKISARELMPPGPPGSPPGAPPGPPPGSLPGTDNAGGFNGREMMARRFKEMDKNGDGKLQKDEANGPLANFFDKADSNKDGVLDETEIRQAMEGMRERVREKGGK